MKKAGGLTWFKTVFLVLILVLGLFMFPLPVQSQEVNKTWVRQGEVIPEVFMIENDESYLWLGVQVQDLNLSARTETSGWQNFSTYTEVDSYNHITVSGSGSTVNGSLHRMERSYIHNNTVTTSGDFSDNFTLTMANNGTQAGACAVEMVTTTLGHFVSYGTARYVGIQVVYDNTTHCAAFVREWNGSWSTGNTIDFLWNTTYYVTFKREGTFYSAEFYTDVERTSLYRESNVTGVYTGSFSYIEPITSLYDTAGHGTYTNYDTTLEPTVVYDTNPLIFTGESNVYKMWFSSCPSPYTTQDVLYAESINGKTGWTIYNETMLSGFGRPHVLKNNTVYYLFCAPNNGSSADDEIRRFNSTDGWNWTNNGVVISKGSSGNWDDNKVANSMVWVESGTWHMMYDGHNATSNWFAGYANSSDGITWTKQFSGPVVSTYGGGAGYVTKVDSTYWFWTWGGATGCTLPTDIYRHNSTNLQTWYNNPSGNSTFFRNGTDEGEGISVGQVADCNLIEVGSQVYLFYAAFSDGTSKTGHIKLAIADHTFATLVTTNEDAWEAEAPETDEEDYVTTNTTDVDSHASHGGQSNFTAQRYGPDSINDTLVEADTGDVFLDDSENWVDNADSNVDTHADHGTHSSFSAEQTTDTTNDTLTEAATSSPSNSSNLLTDGGLESGSTDFDGNGASGWTRSTGPYTASGGSYNPHGGSYFAIFPENTASQYLACDDLDMTTAVAIYVSFWYMDDDLDANDMVLTYWDGAAYDTIQDLSLGTEDTWLQFTVKITDNQYFDADFHIRINCATGNNEAGFIDDVSIIRESGSYNYELDLEVQWTTADYDETNEYLCIRTGPQNSEALKVDAWNGTTWTNLIADLTENAWNNVSISTYLTSENLTIRYLGGTESSDTTQSTWQIESALIHVWSTEDVYELDIEEQFQFVNYTRNNEYLCIYAGAQDAEALMVDAWNGTAWNNVIADLTADSWNNVSVATYLTSENFTIRFRDATPSSDTVQSTWYKDACLLHTWDITGEQYVAELSQSITSTNGIVTKADFKITPAQALSSTWNLLTQSLFHLIPSLSLTFTWAVDIIHGMIVDLSFALATTWTTLTKWTATATFTQSIATTWDLLTKANFNLANSLGLAFTWAVDVYKIAGAQNYVVDFSLALSTAWNLLAKWSAVTTLSQSASLTWGIITRWNAIATLSQSLTSTWNLIVKSTFNIAPSLSAAFTWAVDVYIIAGAQHYVADFTLALSTTWNVLTRWNAIATLTQSLTSTWNLVTQWMAKATFSQSLATTWGILVKSAFSTQHSLSATFAWAIEVIKTVAPTAYVADLALALSTTWNVLTQWNAVATLTQTFATTWNTILRATFNLPISLQVNFAWTLDVIRNTHYYVELAISAVTTWAVDIIKGAQNWVVLTVTITTEWATTLIQVGSELPEEALAIGILAFVFAVAALALLMLKRE